MTLAPICPIAPAVFHKDRRRPTKLAGFGLTYYEHRADSFLNSPGSTIHIMSYRQSYVGQLDKPL